MIRRRECFFRGSKYYTIKSEKVPEEDFKVYDDDYKKRRDERLERERIRREQESREIS